MVFSREQAEPSNIEAIIRQTLGEAAGLALDAQMFSATAGDLVCWREQRRLHPRPTVVLLAWRAILTTCLRRLLVTAGKTAVIIAALPQAVTLKISVGPKFDYDIISSTGLPAGTVVVLEVASLVSGFSTAPEFRVSKTAAYHADRPTLSLLVGTCCADKVLVSSP
jgi:hypothetical protein